MAELLNDSIENKEKNEVLAGAGEEERNRLERELEKAVEKQDRPQDQEKLQEAARDLASERIDETEASQESLPAEKPLTKADINATYKRTLQGMQSQLSKPSRAFSKVIHNPVVEKSSEVIGSTIARPNLVIAGALGAIASIIVYIVARKYGYPLSGFETIALFILGWLVGAVIEYARVGFLNSKRHF